MGPGYPFQQLARRDRPGMEHLQSAWDTYAWHLASVFSTLRSAWSVRLTTNIGIQQFTRCQGRAIQSCPACAACTSASEFTRWSRVKKRSKGCLRPFSWWWDGRVRSGFDISVLGVPVAAAVEGCWCALTPLVRRWHTPAGDIHSWRKTGGGWTGYIFGLVHTIDLVSYWWIKQKRFRTRRHTLYQQWSITQRQ